MAVLAFVLRALAALLGAGRARSVSGMAMAGCGPVPVPVPLAILPHVRASVMSNVGAPVGAPMDFGIAPAGKAAPARRAGVAGLGLIRHFEGCARETAPGQFAAYPDPATGAAPWTIGWGSTGADIGEATRWTQAQCDARLGGDVTSVARQTAGLIGNAPTSANQFDALVCLAYNIGVAALGASTLLAKHKAGDGPGAAAEFGRWNRAGGKAMPGLTRRRAAEAALYATPDGALVVGV